MNDMILEFIDHPELARTEQLIIILHYGRMAKAQTIADLLGISQSTVTVMIHRLNKEGRFIDGKRSRDSKYYFLGPKGCQIANDLLGEKSVFYDYAKSSGKHTDGILQILSRLVKEMGIQTAKEEIYWMNTYQTKQYLDQKWLNRLEGQHASEEAIEKKLRTLIAPDARLSLPSLKTSYWAEFDNGTQTRPQVTHKFISYEEALAPIGDRSPALWVAPTPKRRDQLQKWYDQLKAEKKKLPQMYFYSAGEETEDLMAAIQSLKNQAI